MVVPIIWVQSVADDDMCSRISLSTTGKESQEHGLDDTTTVDNNNKLDSSTLRIRI